MRRRLQADERESEEPADSSPPPLPPSTHRDFVFPDASDSSASSPPNSVSRSFLLRRPFAESNWLNENSHAAIRAAVLNAKIIPISLAEGRSLIWRWRELKRKSQVKASAEAKSDEIQLDLEWPEIQRPIQLEEFGSNQTQGKQQLGDSASSDSVDYEKVLSAFSVRLQKLISSSAILTSGFFLKFNSLSAVDSPLFGFRSKLFLHYLREHLNFLDSANSRNSNSQLIAYMKSIRQVMQLHSAEELIDCFIHSERIMNELNEEIRLFESNSGSSQSPTQTHSINFSGSLILKEWCDQAAVRFQFEFRAFIFNGSLTVLSQRTDFCHFPELAKHESQIRDCVQAVIDSMKSAIPFNNYIADFLILRDRPILIGLNPFNIGASGFSGLFDLKAERQLFITADGPAKIRVRQKPLDDESIKRYYSPHWHRVIHDLLPPLGYWQRFLVDHELFLMPIIILVLIGSFVYAMRIILGFSKWTNPTINK